MRAQSLLVGGAALLSLGLLAGCGSGKVSGSPIASTGGQGAGSQVGAQVKTVSDLSSLVGNNVNHADTVHVKMISGQSSSTGDEKFGDSVAFDVTTNNAASAGVPASQEQMVFVDNVFYMKDPSMAALIGKPWVKIDPSDQSNPLDKVFGAMTSSIKQNANPTRLLQNLEASGTLTGSDTEQLNGQSTTHYKITVDVAKMVASQADATMKQLMTLAEQKGFTNYPVEIWLNSDNLPVQVTIDIPPITGLGSSTLGGKTTITYSDWGAPVTITAPPANQVGSMPSMPGTGNGG